MGLAIATAAARLLARSILQEYDASTVDELAVHLAEFWKLAFQCFRFKLQFVHGPLFGALISPLDPIAIIGTLRTQIYLRRMIQRQICRSLCSKLNQVAGTFRKHAGRLCYNRVSRRNSLENLIDDIFVQGALSSCVHGSSKIHRLTRVPSR